MDQPTQPEATKAAPAPKSLRVRAEIAYTREDIRAILVELVDITTALTASAKLAQPTSSQPAS